VLHGCDNKALPIDEADNIAIMANLFQYYAGVNGIHYGYIDSWIGHSPYIINQMTGPLISLPDQLINQYQIRNQQEASDYLTKLHNLGLSLNEIEQKYLADLKKAVIIPKPVRERSLTQIRTFMNSSVAQHPLLLSYNRKMESSQINPGVREILNEQALNIVSSEIYPLYTRIVAHLQKIHPENKHGPGLWAQPQGSKFYQGLIRFHGDTDLSANEIHEIGLADTHRIIESLHTELASIQLTEGAVSERLRSMHESSNYLFDDSDTGRAKMLGTIREVVSDIQTKLPLWFEDLEGVEGVNKTPITIAKVPKYREDSASSAYYTEPTNTERGTFWVNQGNLQALPSFLIKTLSYHEAIPGHHLQALAGLKRVTLPRLRRIAPYNAYDEGWALYAERLAYEMGSYENDPLGNIGRLEEEILRSIRLVVDTGIHAKRWSRNQAIEYMYAYSGKSLAEVELEIDRYIAMPGQALGYTLGMMKIMELRKKSQKSLGDRFSIGRFHTAILQGGRVPMKQLERQVVRLNFEP